MIRLFKYCPAVRSQYAIGEHKTMVRCLRFCLGEFDVAIRCNNVSTPTVHIAHIISPVSPRSDEIM